MAQWFVPPIVVPVGLLALLLLVALLRHLNERAQKTAPGWDGCQLECVQ